MNSNIIDILKIFVTIVIAFITAYLTNSNERKKQTTMFFKQEGIKVQEELLEFWCSILLSDYKNGIKKYINDNAKKLVKNNNLKSKNKITDEIAIREIQKDTYIYSSKLTIKVIGIYTQEIFKKRKNQRIIYQMYLVGKIICSMKYDFTGEKTTVMDLLKIKINDLDFRKKLKIHLFEILYFLKVRSFKI